MVVKVVLVFVMRVGLWRLCSVSGSGDQLTSAAVPKTPSFPSLLVVIVIISAFHKVEVVIVFQKVI